jgi:acyl-CoA thioester hydrolase
MMGGSGDSEVSETSIDELYCEPSTMPESSPRTSFVVRWADLDSNGHMANTAYLDACVDTRLGYFATRGFTPGDLARHGIAPVVRRDEVDYYRELRLGESYSIDLELAGTSHDGSRFRLRNRFRKEDGTLTAEVVSTGGWLDLRSRRLARPPEPIRDALLALPRSEDFEELPPSVQGEQE